MIVGSGPGGAMAADVLVRAGAHVLMLERGDWVARGPRNALAEGNGRLSPFFSCQVPVTADTDGRRRPAYAFHCVGGQSVFYAGATPRYRACDFEPDPDVLGDSGAAWPFGYGELEPYYARAEALLHVAGVAGDDPLEPPRSGPYPGTPPPFTPTTARLAAAARRRGLRPFRVPVAVRHRRCTSCGACDGHACGVEAKADASTIVAELLPLGLTLWTRVAAVRLIADAGWVTAVEAIDLEAGQRRVIRARTVILAAGTLATPHLVLASGLHRLNPGTATVGRYLTRHANAAVCGVFPRRTGPVSVKELGINDLYVGHPRAGGRKVGHIQQTALPAGLVAAHLPAALQPIALALLGRMLGLVVIAEDQPRRENAVTLDRSRVDALGMPALRVRHRYSARDLWARALLVREAARLLREAGALFTVSRAVDTFTHALGTMRMGRDPLASVLDADGRFRGCANLFVADGSSLPTAAAVNPTLTIGAHALRVASRLLREPTYTRAREARRERREATHV